MHAGAKQHPLTIQMQLALAEKGIGVRKYPELRSYLQQGLAELGSRFPAVPAGQQHYASVNEVSVRARAALRADFRQRSPPNCPS